MSSSSLSSLLVRDGLVGVKRMEKAFQRQVIYGGCLDTILLEMNLVQEDRLTQYLALASGLPPAAREEGETIDEAAVAAISRDIADRYRAVPVAIEGEAVRLLVCAPVELAELEDLADLLDRPLQPLITPEYRWHLVFAAAYGLDPPARFTTLARTLDVDAVLSPVGRARSVIVDERPIPRAPVTDDQTPVPPIYEGRDTQKIVVDIDEHGEIRTDDSRARTHTLLGIDPNRASTGHGAPHTLESLSPDRPIEPIVSSEDETPPAKKKPLGTVGPVGPASVRDKTETEPEPLSRPLDPGLVPGSGLGTTTPTTIRFAVPKATVTPTAAATPSTGVPRPVSDSGPRRRGPKLVRRPPTLPISTEGRDSPLPIVRAREQLATAEDRDTVFLTLLRAARSRARWAGLLTVQGGAAIGRVALAEPGLDVSAVNTVLIPLDVVSPFRAVVGNHQPHVGPLVSGDPGVDAMLLRFGGTLPPSALILPIVLRDRVVAVLVAHRVHSDIRLADVTELLPIATATSDAIGRLIVKHKAAGYRAPAGKVTVPIEPEQVETKRVAKSSYPTTRPDVRGWGAPTDVAPPSIPPEPEVVIEAEEPRPIDEVLDAIERSAEASAEDALTEAVDRAPETIGALIRRFPGRLRVERFGVAGRPLRAAQYGGLLELVVRLGAVSSELLIDKMSAPQRDVRFYATVCAAELRPRNIVFALVERLFDQDYGVRAIAIEALAGYPMTELSEALARARRAVHSSDPEVIGAAASAIVELGDTEAIADLIGVIERGDRGGEHARKALVALTAQDFGPNEKRWRKWYEGARHRHRVEWLIEGLTHKEDAIRESSIDVLRKLTGEYFGYHYNLPRAERDLAAQRWVSWWRETGLRRFVLHESERHRPTAQLPARRD